MSAGITFLMHSTRTYLCSVELENIISNLWTHQQYNYLQTTFNVWHLYQNGYLLMKCSPAFPPTAYISRGLILMDCFTRTLVLIRVDTSGTSHGSWIVLGWNQEFIIAFSIMNSFWNLGPNVEFVEGGPAIIVERKT